MRSRTLEIVGHLLLITCIALIVIAQATSFWYIVEQSDQEGHFGLWQACNRSYIDGSSLCQNIGWKLYDVDAYYVTWQVTLSKGLLLLSDLFILVSLLCLVISLLVSQRGASLVAQGTMLLLTGIAGMSGCGVFAMFPTDEQVIVVEHSWRGQGFSYVIGWCAYALTVILGVLVVVIGNQHKSVSVAPSEIYDDVVDDVTSNSNDVITGGKTRDVGTGYYVDRTPRIYVQQG